MGHQWSDFSRMHLQKHPWRDDHVHLPARVHNPSESLRHTWGLGSHQQLGQKLDIRGPETHKICSHSHLPCRRETGTTDTVLRQIPAVHQVLVLLACLRLWERMDDLALTGLAAGTSSCPYVQAALARNRGSTVMRIEDNPLLAMAGVDQVSKLIVKLCLDDTESCTSTAYGLSPTKVRQQYD